MNMRQLCDSCASSIWGRVAPSERYAGCVSDLLYGTGLAESGYRTRRQYGFDLLSDRGAFSYWQVERVSVKHSLAWLDRRKPIEDRAVQWLYEDVRAVWLPRNWDILKNMLLTSDRLGVLLARLHYLRIAEAVPFDLDSQAQYWKRYYNTHLGKGTVDGYKAAFLRGAGG